ncbi:ribbon-helix-helix domain-containing protein [Aquamicrobium defluvii]|uniref:Antitoxin ParD1/3/4 n=1 Tax=Aquamicrobium defluvii TaxID=69279 RepID=A0A011TBV5_9HYPH|nr:type II toxin-antitoxin system ParD family antitoxin [Aquamicrobium defluvii]EXL01352.1 hypothetical protein BG36_19620 [Aquamicrobium defluvii]EZQ12612.1 hypothetical protein CF98_35200 [Halopseudomonas bauzanensis]TDR29069.1 antitoxin ParD1/3/4 [Aquamicrobium defluvii]
MSVKASISLTESQDAFVRSLVAEGRFSSVSAAIQHGVEMLRDETEARRSHTEALKMLLAERRAGKFVNLEEGRRRTLAMIDRKKAEYGFSD